MAIAAPDQVSAEPAVDSKGAPITTPAPKENPEQCLNDGGAEDSLAALQGMQYVSVTHTADGTPPRHIFMHVPLMIMSTCVLKMIKPQKSLTCSSIVLLRTIGVVQ